MKPTTMKQIGKHMVEVVLHKDAPHNLTRKDVSGTSCYLCGKKCSTKATYLVHMSVSGDLLPVDSEIDFERENESQGFFQIGSECRKQLPKQFVTISTADQN